MIQDGSTLSGNLTTTGRVTGRPHTVRLRLVYYNGRVYASRRDGRSDWCRNALANSQVSVELGSRHFDGTAALVTDAELRQKISELKYGDQRSLEPRIVIEITPASGDCG
ncbi:MAG: nitroreductase family deazaflavin-dependent oxidoreductase [Chloroflexi bacterium]|nr:nitroreductase family deazaflavin-dependent oxidoreductase [Chloroflexota bacterium]